MSHTPEPWTNTNTYVCTEGCEATFIDHGEWLAHEGLHLREQRAELLTALEVAERWIGVGPGGPDSQEIMRKVRVIAAAAIAKAKGKLRPLRASGGLQHTWPIWVERHSVS
jgi:hypothetical protein